jgi:hypothetical protein
VQILTVGVVAALDSLRVGALPTSTTVASSTITDSPGWLKYTKDAAAMVQSLATIVALLVGAWWVLRRRRTYPRANFTHSVSHVPLSENTHLVRVTVGIENIGDVLLCLRDSAIGIQQVVPVPEQVRPTLESRLLLLGTAQDEIQWPFIDARFPDWTGAEIEPGESAGFQCELLAPRSVRFILVYSYFRNITKPGNQGWNTTTLYELKESATIDVVR